MSFKKLSQPSGSINMAHLAEDNEDQIVRQAILVHSAPNGKAMVFQSADGPIEFDDARIKRIVENHNDKILELAKGYGGIESMPTGAFPPILDQHSDDSNNRIRGRLNSLLAYEKRDVPGVGKNCSCVTTKILFLGKDTVKQVNDGRIYHLSIGIDEETDTLGETSTVIEPAAPGAMLLNKIKKSIKGETKMAKNKKLALASKARLAKLKALKSEIDKGVTALSSTKENIKLTKKKGDIASKLTKLMSTKKLMPSEFKKMNIAKLAKLDDESLETVLSTFEARENVVMAGQRGTSDAAPFSEMGKSLEKRQMKRLSSETRKDLIKLGAKLKSPMNDDEQEDEKHMSEHEEKMKHMNEEPMHPGKDEHAVEGSEGFAKMSAHLEEMGKHLEAGNIDEAKKVHADMCKMAEGGEFKHMSDGSMSEKGEDYEKSMSGVQSQVDELNTQMARLAGMVSELMSGEEEEGHDLEAGDEEEEEKEEIKSDVAKK